jgi:lipopolysaccharide export system protein LptC
VTGVFNKAALALLLAALAALSWWMPNALVAPAALLDQRTRHDPDYYIENFTATAMDEHGAKKYLLTARRLTHYPDDLTAYLTQPRLVQYKPGTAPIHTAADHGQITHDSKYLLMRGNVRVVQSPGPAGGPAGAELRTQELRIYLE